MKFFKTPLSNIVVQLNENSAILQRYPWLVEIDIGIVEIVKTK